MAENETEPIRADRWLWAVRAFKTRSQATTACKLGQVRIEGSRIKPSRALKVGQIVTLQRGQLTRTLRVLGALGKRVSAKEAVIFCEDMTPEEEYAAAARASKQMRENRVFNMPGQGKPTRRQLREIKKFLHPEEDA